MKLLNVIFLIFALFYSFCGKSQQNFEQGYFESDESYTERVKREFEPNITEVKICPIGFNGRTPHQVMKDIVYGEPKYMNEIVKSLNGFNVTFNVLQIHSNGDILYDQSKIKLECRLIVKSDSNIAILETDVQELSIRALVGLNQDLVFTFHELNIENSRYDKMVLELRRNNIPIYKSSFSFTLNTFFGEEANNCIYGK